MSDRLVGYASIATAALSWGSLPVIVPAAQAPAPVLVAMRMGFGAAALAPFLLVFGRADLVPRTSRRLVAALGAMLALNWVLFFRGIQLIGATAVLIGYVFPVLVAISAPIVIREKREPHVLPAAGVGLAGLALILVPQARGGSVVGAACSLGAAVITAGLLLGARRVVETVPGPVVAFWQYLIGAVLLLPWAMSVADGLRPRAWLWGALIGVVQTAGAGILFFRGIGRIPAQEAGVLMYLEPVFAVVFVWLFRSVAPAAMDLVGGGLVVAAGALIVSMSGRTAREATREPVGI